MSKATREAYGEEISKLIQENPKIVVLDADLAGSTYSGKAGEVCPERFFDMGIAEANMIGVSKNIIIFAIGPAQIVMYNPKITKKSRPYKVKEGCLSLEGERNTTRYENITVEYQDESFKKCKQSYSGFVAQIIQHEIDHCNGIII